MIILDKLEQGSKEWLDARCGVITASCFNKIITPTGKSVTGKARQDYMFDLIHEQITGEPIFIPPTKAMQRGTDLEPEARNAFEFIENVTCDQIGMIYLDESKTVSCSPDGLLGNISGNEIKCPLHKVHLKTVLDNSMPNDHIQQVQGCMWVSGRDHWYFMSYHPQHKPFITLIQRDNDYIDKLSKCVYDFKIELQQTKESILK